MNFRTNFDGLVFDQEIIWQVVPAGFRIALTRYSLHAKGPKRPRRLLPLRGRCSR